MVTEMSEQLASYVESTVQEALKSLGVDPAVGLRPSDVQSRLKEHGYNEILEQKSSPLLAFLRKFWGISAWMLELIILISLFLRKFSDLYIVAALLVVNAVLSFVQERRAAGIIDVLRSELHVSARTLRDGLWQVLPARELVPGDIVRLRAGDLVPADVKIISGNLSVDQSALTGESLEVDKNTHDLVHSGSVVRCGEATVVVLLTGSRTLMGRTVELVQIARPKLHVEQVISDVAKWLFVIVAALLLLVLIVSVLRGMPLLDMVPLMLVLLLGAVPVALPVMFTVTMALGSMKLAAKGVLVTRLSAADDAATVDVLCTDKTGTITTNRLAVTCVLPLNGHSEQDVLLCGSLASEDANQDPIDLAFADAACQRGVDRSHCTICSFVPFSPHTRRTEALVRVRGQELLMMKGAVSIISTVLHLSSEESAELEQQAGKLSSNGQRTLAVATVDDHKKATVVGLVALSDTPRPDSARLIRKLRDLGVSVKMLTGDALPIAVDIADSVGLGKRISHVRDLQKAAEHDMALAGAIAEQSDGFAEVYPEDKYTVVKSLQALGHTVAMTGDGINDAPALRQAEVGIAVSNATDVAKSSASVVLTDEGLTGIVDLIVNGRMIYQRIATWIVNKISRTILKSAFVVVAFLTTGQFVVSAYAMMLMMFLTDFVKISLSTDNVRVSRGPEKWDVPGLVKVAVVLGLFMVAESLGLLYIGYTRFGLATNADALHTFAFETLFYFAMFSILAVRERRHFWDSVPSRTMLTAIGVDLVIGTLIPTFGVAGLHPLPPSVTAFVLLYSLLFSLVVNDMVKWLLFRRQNAA